MDDDQNNEQHGLLAWILGIAVTIAIAVAVLSGVLGALGGGAQPAASSPAAAPAAQAAPTPIADVPAVKLYFDSGKAELPADAAAALAPVVDAVKSGKAKKVLVSGYHDATGSPEKNAELAKQRAFAVRDALGAAGLAPDQVVLAKPQETSGGADDREARRVEAAAAN